MEEAERLCDRVAIIDKGRLLALGTGRGAACGRTAHVRHSSSRPIRASTRIETDDPLAELNRLAAPGDRRSLFTWSDATLEQVFLHLTGRSLRD